MPATFDNFVIDSGPVDIEIAGPNPCLVVFTLTVVGDPQPTTITANGLDVPALFPDAFDVLQSGVVATFRLQAWGMNNCPTGTVTLDSDGGPLIYGLSYTQGTIFGQAESDGAVPESSDDNASTDIAGETGEPIIGFIMTDSGPATLDEDGADTEFTNFGNQATAQWTAPDNSSHTYTWLFGETDEHVVGWTSLFVALGPSAFVPSPCAAVYLDFNDVTALANGEEVFNASLPEFGSPDQPNFWGQTEPTLAPVWFAAGGPNDLAYLNFDFGEGPTDSIFPSE